MDQAEMLDLLASLYSKLVNDVAAKVISLQTQNNGLDTLKEHIAEAVKAQIGTDIEDAVRDYDFSDDIDRAMSDFDFGLDDVVSEYLSGRTGKDALKDALRSCDFTVSVS